MLKESGEIPLQAEVIILGAGMAGHCAALAAATVGAEVLMLEKTTSAGGSAAIAILAFVRDRNSGKQRTKQPATRYSSFVKPSAVQGFRGL